MAGPKMLRIALLASRALHAIVAGRRSYSDVACFGTRPRARSEYEAPSRHRGRYRGSIAIENAAIDFEKKCL